MFKMKYGPYPFFFFFFKSLAVLRGMWDRSSWTRGSNLCPLHWEGRVLTTGPPGKSQPISFISKNDCNFGAQEETQGQTSISPTRSIFILSLLLEEHG